MASSAPDHLRTPGLISNRPCYEGINIEDWFPLEGEQVDIYAEFFRDEKPANAIMEVSRLAEPGLEVEIEATAVLD